MDNNLDGAHCERSSGVDLIAGKHPLLPGLSLLMVGTVLLAFLVRRSLSRSHPLFTIDLLRIRLVRLSRTTIDGAADAGCTAPARVNIPVMLPSTRIIEPSSLCYAKPCASSASS